MFDRVINTHLVERAILVQAIELCYYDSSIQFLTNQHLQIQLRTVNMDHYR